MSSLVAAIKVDASRTNLLDYDQVGLATWFDELGEPKYRAAQVFQWIHRGVTDFQQMTNVSKKLQQRLADIACVKAPEVGHEHVSLDNTVKWLMRLCDGNAVETVYIPERGRGTLCVSSQVGCSLNCSFCSTGKQGFNRNLSTAEIIGQVWRAARRLPEILGEEFQITNVVMMGMGEPLLNFDAVVPALNIMLDNRGYNLSKYRVTLSTSGLIPQMKALREQSKVALAVSLHAPNDQLRNILVPLNKKYPLAELMTACREYFSDEPRRSVTFEYVMIQDVNDQPEHAKQLTALLKKYQVPAKMNLIPFNPFPGTDYERSAYAAIEVFKDILTQAGITTTVRKTRGDDIDAACGQLVGKVADRTGRSAKWAMMNQMKMTDGISERGEL